jgi:hypothetical protein
MKRSLLFLFIVLFTFTGIFASDWVELTSDQPADAEITLISSSSNHSTVSFTLDGFFQDQVMTDEGIAWLITSKTAARMLTKGAPDLPVFAKSLIVPDKAKMTVKVINSEYIEFKDILVAPSKGNLTRDIKPSEVAYEYGKYYDVNEYFPGDLARLDDPYIVRDYRGQAVKIQPFQYNPVTRTLRVYYSITLQVTEDGISNYNVIERTQPVESVDSRFLEVYKRHFLNFNTGSRYDPVGEHGNMLVISYGDFMDAVQPLVDWKIKTGTPTELVDVETIGNAYAIKSYIADYYEENGLTFVLLVGDAAQVPSSTNGGNDSDVDYSYVVGNDHYPDLFVGRFSAENVSHVNTMVDRTLTYERDPIADTSWYKKTIGIASQEGTGDDGEYDYQHVRNIQNNKLIPFTYNYAYELFEGSQGGNDEPGHPNISQVSEAVNAGATVINYTGHGSTTSWVTSGFNNSAVNNLTNVGKWPFIVSVACVNGNFVGNTCFAEAWTRAEDGGEPAGAIATLMSTINQGWNPPMRGQDEMADILVETYSDNIKRTYGGITMNGVMNMNDVYGSAGYTETDCWTIFGDPSVIVRTSYPEDMTVNHAPSITVEDNTFTVTCDAEGGVAALTKDGEILGAAFVEGGSATISFDVINDVGAMVDLVITGFNFRPYITSLEITPPPGPNIVYAGSIINDETGNQDGKMDYAEEILLTVSLTNNGVQDAPNVRASISSESHYITFTQTEAVFGDIAVGDTILLADAFQFQVADDIPDKAFIGYSLTIEDDFERSVYVSNFILVSHAPKLTFMDYRIDDNNGNGKMDPGESAELIATIKNKGSSEAYNIMSLLSTISPYLTILSDPQEIGDLPGGESVEVTYFVQASGDTPEGHIAGLELDMVAEHNISVISEFNTIIGQKAVLVLQFAPNSRSADTILSCLNTLSVGADVATEFPENLDVYKSLFVLLGIFPDNYTLSGEEGQMLADFLENGGRIYMEGGDAWFSDEKTAVHSLFHIEGIEDGFDDLNVVTGEENSMFSGFMFEYDGPNNYIDHIAPMDDAKLLMSNNDPDYGVMVSYAGDDYKTIGTSFCFEGLTDTEESTKDGMMAEMLDFFEVGFTWTNVEEIALQESSVSAYPNPFSGQVNIAFQTDHQSNVSIDIFDLTGRKVMTLIDEELNAGVHRYQWNADNQLGQAVKPGIYFYSLRVGEQVTTRKLILTR